MSHCIKLFVFFCLLTTCYGQGAPASNTPQKPVYIGNTEEPLVNTEEAVSNEEAMSNTEEAVENSPEPPPVQEPPVEAEAVSSEPSLILDTLDLRDMDINDVLKLLASKSGLNIIAGKSITGRVTIFLKNVEVHNALTIILKANDLAYMEDGNVVQILTEAEYEQMTGHKFGVNNESAVIALHSLKASDAMALLNQVKSTSGKIIADDQSNSIIIEDVPARIEKLREYIEQIDLPTQEKVYQLKYASVEGLAAKLQEMSTPKIGTVKSDGSTNKIFIKDTTEKLKQMDAFISQIDVARKTQVFQISYAKADDLAKTVAPLLTKDIGTLQYDTRSNTLIVTDVPPKIDEIKVVVSSLDRNDKEVLIEAKIVQIDLTDEYQMGINWEKILPNAEHAVVDLKNNFSLAGSVTPVSTATIGTLDRDGYNVVLQMIATLGNSRLLSNPRIAVINNQEARILVGTTTPYVTDSTTTPATGPTVTAETVNFIDTGVKLHVTPKIHDDGFITMKIKPEVSNIPKSITSGNNNQIPVVDTSEVETTIRVKDGVTIIIGGLIKNELKHTQNKIPLLGDIPFLGKAFRNESRKANKTEIVIFLTPHIITGDVQVNPDKYPYMTIKSNKTYYNPLPKNTSTDPVPN